MHNITIALRTSSFSCIWFHDFPVFMSADITHLSNPFKSEAVLTSLWMSNLFPSQFSLSPLCFVKKKKKMAPSTEKPRQFMCRYRCRYMQSYFCFSFDHVDTHHIDVQRGSPSLTDQRDLRERGGTFWSRSQHYNPHTVCTARQPRRTFLR